MAMATKTETQSPAALVERQEDRLQAIAGVQITTAQQLYERIKQLHGQAHILSPMTAVAAIPPGHVITPVVVVIDPSVDPESGRGADVYHQPAIHKHEKIGKNDYRPLEVSLNKTGLLKFLQAFGVNVYPTERLDDGTERNIWIMRSRGDVMQFDGSIVALPAGTASVDLRDGSADIGEWMPDEWAARIATAEKKRAMTPDAERWRVRPEPINGWTYDRVLQARKFGLRLAEAKSLNALARNLGVRQMYTIAELQAKPFVVFRAQYVPDTSDPEVRRMLTAASLGARNLLYPGAPAGHALAAGQAPVSHGIGDPTAIIEHSPESEAPDRMLTAQPPADAEELAVEEPTPPQPAEVYVVTRVLQHGEGAERKYYVETGAGVTLYTTDAVLAKACATAKKDGQPRAIPTERVVVAGQAYRQIIEISVPGQPGLKL